MTKKMSLFILITMLVSTAVGQSEWENWDKNYQEQKYSKLVAAEKAYSDSIEKNQEIAQYYSRLDKYKIQAKFLGKTRRIKSEVLLSMKRVFKLFIGKDDSLEELVKNELLFEIDGAEVWMPIQKQLEKPFKEEVSKGSEPSLYCLFLNEHPAKGTLFNTLLVSEFRID